MHLVPMDTNGLGKDRLGANGFRATGAMDGRQCIASTDSGQIGLWDVLTRLRNNKSDPPHTNNLGIFADDHAKFSTVVSSARTALQIAFCGRLAAKFSMGSSLVQ